MNDLLLSLAQAVSKGLLTGMVYGRMALGLSVIFGVMRVVNFAHGEMMIVGMYLAWMGFDYLQLDPTYSLPLIALVFFAVGYRIAQTDKWPDWKPGNEFKAKRDAMLKK